MTAPTEKYSAPLAKLLRSEITTAGSLLAALKTERDGLATLDEALINANVAAKEERITQLQAATAERLTFMTNNGLNISGYSPTDGSEPNQDSLGAELDTLLDELAKLARQCFDENRLVGQLLNRHTHFISQAIASLSPASGNRHSLTYGENGSINSTDNSQDSLLYPSKI